MKTAQEARARAMLKLLERNRSWNQYLETKGAVLEHLLDDRPYEVKDELELIGTMLRSAQCLLERGPEAIDELVAEWTELAASEGVRPRQSVTTSARTREELHAEFLAEAQRLLDEAERIMIRLRPAIQRTSVTRKKR